MAKKFDKYDAALWEAVTSDIVPLGAIAKQPSKGPGVLLHGCFTRPIDRGTLDLHGLTLDAAYAAAKDYVDKAIERAPTIITGISGQIKSEFEFWFENHPSVRKVESLNGGGAYRLHLKKQRNAK